MINVDGPNKLPESIKHNRERLKKTAEKKIPKKNQPVLFAAKEDLKPDALDMFAPIGSPVVKKLLNFKLHSLKFDGELLLETAPFAKKLINEIKKAQEE